MLSLNSTDYTMLYAQKGDRVVTTDCVTSLHPMFMSATSGSFIRFYHTHFLCSLKGKVFPYSLPSVGPGADPGVQAVSPQVT